MANFKLTKNHHYGCVGREETQRDLLNAWQEANKRVFNCYGGKESGKSCFIRTVLDDFLKTDASGSIVIDTDFKSQRIGPKDSRKFWGHLSKKLELSIIISDPMTEESMDNFLEQIEERNIIFLFDNLDHARNAKADDKSSETENDLFSELQDKFIPAIVQRTNLCIVFITSTVQLRYGQIAPTVHKIEMNPLSTKSAGELLLKTIKLTSDMDENSASLHLGPYLEPIARLSEGIPMAVILTGIQLTENSFFIKPKEMLTVLIFSRIYTLSPEFFPKDDNMFQTYKDYIENQSSGMKGRLQDMGKMGGSSFTVDVLMQHLCAKDGKSFFKTQTVIPMLLRSLVKHVENPDKLEMLEMQGFLWEFVNIEKIIDSFKGLDEQVMLQCKNIVHDCLRQLGKNIDIEMVEKIITNPGAYDEFVEKTIVGPTSEDRQTDMGKNDLGKPFTGYSQESLIGYSQEPNSPNVLEQRMQELKLPETLTWQLSHPHDANADSQSSFNRGTTNEEMQGEQTEDFILPGHLAEQLVRYNHNVSHMPISMERSPQSLADAGLIYQEKDFFKCQYCEVQIHRSDLTGNLEIMQKHREINPRCPYVRQDRGSPRQNSSQQVKDKETLNERKVSKTMKGDAAYTMTGSGPETNSEEIKREFLQLGHTGNDGKENKENDTKNDKFNNSSNLSSSYGNKTYPNNKMDPSEKKDHAGPKEADNWVGVRPKSSSESGKCTQQVNKNDLHEVDVNTERKRSYVEHKVNRGSKDDEGYVSPQNSDSDEQASPDPGRLLNPE